MKLDDFLRIARDLAESGIGVDEQVEMMEGSQPLLDGDGNPVVWDVVIFGDARVYIERDDNDPDAVQDFIDWLNALDEYLPEIIDLLSVAGQRR